MKARPVVLGSLLLAISLAALIRLDWSNIYFADFLPLSSVCTHDDARIQEAVRKLEKFAMPGFQLSYRDAKGIQVNCASGWADKSFPGRRVKFDDQFRYASITKIFTAFVILTFVYERKLNLDDTLVDVLGVNGPFQDYRVSDIRIVDLLQHSSGFDRHVSGDPMFKSDVWCPGEVEKLTSVKLDFNPGSAYAYSNLGYCLLGLVIERVEGRSVEDVFREKIFTPAEVISTELAQQGALGLSEVNIYPQSTEDLSAVLGLDYSKFVAVGGWVGSASDFNKAAGFIFENGGVVARLDSLKSDYFGPCQVHVLRSCHGKIFYKHEQPNGQAMFWRDGSLPGVSTVFSLFADSSSVVFLGNSRGIGSGPNNNIVEIIYDVFGAAEP